MDHEINAVIFNMGALKASSEDSLNALFFQNQWKVVKPTACNFVMTVFTHLEMIKEVNKTLLVLIPKMSNLEIIK